jgi:hypothetical protein
MRQMMMMMIIIIIIIIIIVIINLKNLCIFQYYITTNIWIS